MIKIALYFSLFCAFTACATDSTGSSGSPGSPIDPAGGDQDIWKEDSNPVSSYASDVTETAKKCRDGSALIATGEKMSDAFIDLFPESVAPLRKFAFKVRLTNAWGAKEYVFEHVSIYSDGTFKTWTTEDLGDGRSMFIQVEGLFEKNQHGATRVTGHLEKYDLVSDPASLACSYTYDFR